MRTIKKEDREHEHYQDMLNEQKILGMNRANRRAAQKIMNIGYSADRLSQELKRLDSSSSKGSPLIKMWKYIIKRFTRPDPYYFHIQKCVRPMMYVGEIGAIQASFVKCEKIRKKG